MTSMAGTTAFAALFFIAFSMASLHRRTIDHSKDMQSFQEFSSSEGTELTVVTGRKS